MLFKTNDGARTENFNVRATMQERELISRAAVATRRTMSNFILLATLQAAEKTLSEDANAPAIKPISALPPAANQQNQGAGRVIKQTQRIASNLTQLRAHAERLGGQLDILLVEKGHLNNLSAGIFKLGLSAKAGTLDGASADALANKLDAPSQLINKLARSLNQGLPVQPIDWVEPIKSLLGALGRDG